VDPVWDAPLISALEVFELIALASLAACTVWLLFRSYPSALDGRQKRVEAISAELASQVAAIVDERAVWKLQGERLAQEVSTYLDQIERKRSSTAASASRIKGAQLEAAPDIASMTRNEQIALARRSIG